MKRIIKLNRDPKYYIRQDFKMLGLSMIAVLGPWALFPMLDKIDLSYLTLKLGIMLGIVITICGIAASLGRWGMHSKRYTLAMIGTFVLLGVTELKILVWSQWYWAMERGFFLD